MCLMIFSTVMLLSCFGIMGSLFWMFVQLKTEVQELKLDITKVESSTSQKIKDFIVKEIQTNLFLKNMEIKNEELSRAAGNVLSLQDQVTALQNLTSSLSPSYFAVVDEIKGLSKTLADDGSFLKTLKEEVSDLKKYKLENKELFINLQNKILHFEQEIEKLENETNSKVLHLQEMVTNRTQLFDVKFNESFAVMENFNATLHHLLSQTSSLETKLTEMGKNSSKDAKLSPATIKHDPAPPSEMSPTPIPRSLTTKDGSDMTTTLHAG